MTSYLEPTQEAGRAFFTRRIQGPVVMLNVLRFREIADYSGSPELAPAAAISGAEAYRGYTDHTLPFLKESGGEVIFLGNGAGFLVGPQDERWDAAMLVRQASVEAFPAFATNPAYLAGMGHRTATLEDSRLLPLTLGDCFSGGMAAPDAALRAASVAARIRRYDVSARILRHAAP